MENFDVKHKEVNASCGDDLTLYLKWQGDALTEVSFEGFGCAISQSGASMLTDKVKRMTRTEMEALTSADMYALYGTTISPQREKCALLALHTLKEALAK